LALTYVGILDHFRPKWFVWENVPGVLSSNQGKDFAAFLTSLGIIGYGWSYRVLDAQYFGVAQRRRRVFVVGHLGDWRPTAEVLFESESLSRNTKKGREKRKETSQYVANSIGTMCARDYKGLSSDDVYSGKAIVEVYENHPSDSRVKEMGDVCQTVTSSWGTGGGNIPFVQNLPIAWDAELNANENKMGTLLRGGQGGRTDGVMMANMAVRRLTPIECERLQGFPDGYTDIKPNGKETPDGHRYKALGNSMAVPVMRWIGERINSYETMRSKAAVQMEIGLGIAEV
jgi:DNA (cytosine-5)-methyltransferase 1